MHTPTKDVKANLSKLLLSLKRFRRQENGQTIPLLEHPVEISHKNIRMRRNLDIGGRDVSLVRVS